MLLDTGARLSDVVGLKCEDVVLDAPIPHMVVHKNTLRRLKTKATVRKTPLVGHALEAAKRAIAKSKEVYLFPRYVNLKKGKIENDSASATLNKALKSRDCFTCHHMRHTMRARLRNADVPAIRAEELQGWARASIADQYGDQTALKNLQADLLKTL